MRFLWPRILTQAFPFGQKHAFGIYKCFVAWDAAADAFLPGPKGAPGPEVDVISVFTQVRQN